MDLQIRGHDIVISDELRDFVAKRSAKLDHLVDKIVDAKLELRTRHQRSGETTTAQLTIQTRGRILRAEEDDRDPFLAVDRAVDKLARQIRRFHDKRTDRKGTRPEPALEAFDMVTEDADLLAADDVTAGDQPTLVRTKRFSLKPMDVDEAIEQMELLGHDFYLFHNVSEQQLNVLYRRRDGDYGLLAPHVR